MRNRDLAHTYSIVAADLERGEIGCAVQSHFFAVGALCLWAQPGAGVVATQAMVNADFGTQGLKRLAAGVHPPVALRQLLAGDEGSQHRQLALLAADGSVATHTGDRCIEAAGHAVGDGYSVQANMMLNEDVWPAMAQAFEAHDGILSERLLAALYAAQDHGGDIRGKQSAAIVVVSNTLSGDFHDRWRVNLRVEDHPDPLRELQRLLQLQYAYDHVNRGDAAMEQAQVDAALTEYAAARRLAPDIIELQYWHAIALANAGRLDDTRDLLIPVFAAEPNWRELTRRLHRVGLLAFDRDALDFILAD